jgi:hypothetical protein
VYSISDDKTEESSRVMHTGPRNTMEETNLGKRRMAAPFQGGQSPDGVVAPHMDGRKDGHEACTKEMRKSTKKSF